MFKNFFATILLLSSLNLYSQHDGNHNLFHLGRTLFFDNTLSGNKNISCLTCHHPQMGSSDQLSLGIGEGGVGMGLKRTPGQGPSRIHERIPRNSPALYNLGHKQYRSLFHDGRVRYDKRYPSGIKSPANYDLPEGLKSLLAAQALFPLQSESEMAGQKGENPIADAAAEGRLAGPDGVWNLIARRIQKIPQYVSMFKKAFPDSVNSPKDIDIVKIANAIGAWEDHAFTSRHSRYDYYRKKSARVSLTKSELNGEKLFYGKARCSQCHSGPLFTDHKFYSIALPPIGPGKGDGYKGFDDFGLERETGDKKDRYKFRTPSLRNITRTAPYGHNGAYTHLKEIVRHHLNPRKSLSSYNPKKQEVRLPFREDLHQKDFVLLKNEQLLKEIAESSNLTPVRLTELELIDLVNFLKTLEEVNFNKRFSRFTLSLENNSK